MSLYFDHNAAAPLRPCAHEAWNAAAREAWANPSALYPAALAAKAKLEAAREKMADFLFCPPGRIVFTSGATEANNAVFRRFAQAAEAGEFCAVSAIEHPSVLEPARALFGKRLLLLPVGPDGWLDIAASAELIHEKRPALVSVMAANSETGVLQPWLEIASLCREYAIPFHCDAVQLLGRVPLGDIASRADYLSLGFHKIGGPRGAGLLLAPAEDSALRVALGGTQEAGRRAGTENVAAVAAAAEAMKEALDEVHSGLAARQGEFRDAFEKRLTSLGAEVVGGASPRLPQTSLLLLPRHEGTTWVSRLARLGFACGTGSACGSGKSGPSHVLTAMGVDADRARRAVRVSASAETSEEDWRALADAFATALAGLDAESAASGVVRFE